MRPTLITFIWIWVGPAFAANPAPQNVSSRNTGQAKLGPCSTKKHVFLSLPLLALYSCWAWAHSFIWRNSKRRETRKGADRLPRPSRV